MDEQDLFEYQLNSTEVFHGNLLHVYSDQIRLPNGKTSSREYIKHNGAVCIVPVTENGDVYVVRQFRYPFHSVMLELPAGKIDAGESPDEAAVRELSEETGLRNAVFTPIGKLYPSVAYTDEIIYLYIARDFDVGTMHTDADEFLNVQTIPLNVLKEMVMNGEISDAKTQTAILKAFLMLKS